MNRTEVWEHVVQAVEREFEQGEFEPGEFTVQHNTAGGTITIIESGGRTDPTLAGCEAFTIADITGSYNTGGANEEDPVHIVMPVGTLADKLKRTLS